MRKYKIGISGSYGGLNLGDEAILQSIIKQITKKVSAEITIFSKVAEDTKERYNVRKVVPVRELSKKEIEPEIEELDLFLLGGGGILYDGEAKIYLREVEIAVEKKVPTMIYAISAGPLVTINEQEAVKNALNETGIITVRDKKAAKILEEIGVTKEIKITADPAFLIKPEPLPKNALQIEHMEGKQRLIAMSVREQGNPAPDINPEIYHSILANAADYMVDRYDAHIVFIPMERQKSDMQNSHAVISQMLRPQRAWVLKAKYTPGQVLSLMKYFDLAVGMRLHFLIFAALQEVPFVALSYSPKVEALLNDFEIDIPPIHLVNSGRLIAHIDRSWDQYNDIKRKIRRIVPDIKTRSLKTSRLAIDFLKDQNRNRRV